MPKRVSIPVVAALAGLSLLGLGAAGLPEQEPAGAPTAMKLADLGWLAGHWRLEDHGSVVEELWMPPRGGLMLGLNRSVEAGREQGAFEYLRIVADAHGVVYLASPGGGEATGFRLSEVDAHHAVFVNPQHDFPKRIEYRRAANKLTAAIAGDEPGPSWTFERVGDVD